MNTYGIKKYIDRETLYGYEVKAYLEYKSTPMCNDEIPIVSFHWSTPSSNYIRLFGEDVVRELMDLIIAKDKIILNMMATEEDRDMNKATKAKPHIEAVYSAFQDFNADSRRAGADKVKWEKAFLLLQNRLYEMGLGEYIDFEEVKDT